ncbi:hypothetical protein HWV62_4876 [Athelia sp. TMB]|nr:hypothetical protein HWV62_4876 [Athelia sp. TMB]
MANNNDGRYPPTVVTGSGTNIQGNRYSSRVDPDGNTGYHYSNACVPSPIYAAPVSAMIGCVLTMATIHSDDSYYYKNIDVSKYYNSGSGYAQYTTPGGDTYRTDTSHDQQHSSAENGQLEAGGYDPEEVGKEISEAVGVDDYEEGVDGSEEVEWVSDQAEADDSDGGEEDYDDDDDDDNDDT